MAAARYHLLHEMFTSRPRYPLRKRNGCIRVSVKKAKLSDSGGKIANLSAKKKERIKLPNYGDGTGEGGVYHISEFFNHPSGIESILNTRALQSYQSLDSNLYSLRVPKMMERQKQALFRYIFLDQSEPIDWHAFMRNNIKWESFGSEQFLNVDVKLNLVLEIYTRPFTLLPVSAVEGPGNKVMPNPT
ncbi:hypothetical protein PHJA_000301800 [Phtheirospermum japonicum]|uniref:Uncharacterized protein n=1 Tax=Phtheirospermum japonicum TaxID=374723 RepID=A0A830BC63_9LAMI|nr:hypothetical protein PHJA_000301800 [Phtheirospermum japonicum]